VEFKIKKPVFSSALHKCGSTVSRRDAVPVLKNFLIQADEREVRIVGTDLELGLVARILVVDVQEQGRITVPAEKLLPIVDEAEDGDVTFKVTDGAIIEIKAGPTEWQVHGTAADDYPEVPIYDQDQSTPLNREAFLAAVRRVRKAASDDEQRLNLMMLRFRDGKVFAADGHRLHVATLPNHELDMSLPVLAVNELIRLLERSEAENAFIQITNNHLLFKIGNEVFSSGKLQAEFPDVEKAILAPTEKNNDTFKVDRTALLSAVRRVKITSDDKTHAVNLILGETEVQLSSADETGNTATEKVSAKWTGEKDRVLGLNYEYLEDLLNAFEESTIEFKLGDDAKHRKAPVRVDGEGLTAVVLPLRVDAPA